MKSKPILAAIDQLNRYYDRVGAVRGTHPDRIPILPGMTSRDYERYISKIEYYQAKVAHLIALELRTTS